MTAAYWMNAGALLLGLAAWVLGAASIRIKRCQGLICNAGNFAACSGSLCLELCYQAHLSKIEDISAFLDTANAVAMCASVLLVVTLILNTIAVCVYKTGFGSAMD